MMGMIKNSENKLAQGINEDDELFDEDEEESKHDTFDRLALSQ